jgi:trans-aconitate methyltransferase
VNEGAKETWGVGEKYEGYVGRWSRYVAREFLAWLAVSEGKLWVDVGCGTGALVEGILRGYAPGEVIGVDRSAGFLAGARQAIQDGRARFEMGDALALPLAAESCDVAVSGLVLNFVPDHARMAGEMVRVTKPGGKVAVYVWDYAGGMQMMRYFWDAAAAVDSNAAQLDQGERFPICKPEALRALFEEVGVKGVAVRAIDIQTVFQDFDDFWLPFLGKQGAAPTYLAGVDEDTREKIRQRLEGRLVKGADGSIALTARAWAVQGVV